jgi:hypothetical protein
MLLLLQVLNKGAFGLADVKLELPATGVDAGVQLRAPR